MITDFEWASVLTFGYSVISLIALGVMAIDERFPLYHDRSLTWLDIILIVIFLPWWVIGLVAFHAIEITRRLMEALDKPIRKR